MHSPSVSIVILNFNGKNYLEQFLPSVVASSYPEKHIIVADNGSTDGSVLWMKENHPEIKLILLEKNYGFAEGYNQALKQVESDYYILLNSDVEVSVNWIAPIIHLMEGDIRIAACQPKILSFHQKEKFEYAGAAGGWIDALGYPFSRGRIFDECEEDVGQYNKPQEVFWASGAAIFIRAEIFHSHEGFDGFFFAHMEEIDLCWRLQLSGYKIMCCPESIVYHVGGGTLPKGNSRKVFLNFRNNLLMLTKNLSPGEKIWKIPIRFFLDALFAWKSLLTGEPVAFKAVMMAHIAVIKGNPKPNKTKCKKRWMKNLTGVYHGSLIWQHFVENKKRFSEIVDKNFH